MPKKTLAPSVDAALVGTPSKPALTVEGLAVKVDFGRWNADVTVSGPVVPGEGLPYQTASTTCTWTVTIRNPSGDVPVALADFHAIDHLGTVLHVSLIPGEKAPPSVVRRGESVTFEVRAYERVGDGVMQWAPDGHHVVANWDFSVEND